MVNHQKGTPEALKENVRWCLKKPTGIKLIEPNENLCEQYFREADETITSMIAQTTKWQVIMAYYACYNALYGLLQKAGIKCEIHDCSIALMILISQFTPEDIKYMDQLKKHRISVQYYLKELPLEDVQKVKSFVLKCKHIRDDLQIDEFRNLIEPKTEGDEN